MQIIIVMCMQVSRDYVVDLDVGISIRECSSTLYIGLAKTASPTIQNQAVTSPDSSRYTLHKLL